MIRLFYLLVIIHVSHGCFNWNRIFFGNGKNANDTAITTESYANSTSPSNVTSNPPNSGPMNETSIKPEAGDKLKKQPNGLDGMGPNLSVNDNSTGKATSSSIRSQLGLEFLGFSLAVVCFLF
ncbi:hypothetical protein SprV_0802630100 [Sparganum proliferum]